MSLSFKLLVTLLSVLLFFTACSNDDPRYIEEENSSGSEISYLVVTPRLLNVKVSTKTNYKAIAYYKNNTSEDVTLKVQWKSSKENVVSILSGGQTPGLANALSNGFSVISATYDSVTSNSALIRVSSKTLVSISLTPELSKIPLGVNVQYSAIGLYSDGSSLNITPLCSYESSDINVSTVSSLGLAKTLNFGTTNISASYLGTSSNVAVLNVTTATVTSIKISPVRASVAKGTQGKFTAIATFSDASFKDVSKQVLWNSSDTNVLTIESQTEMGGEAIALNVGVVNVTASLNSVKSNIATVSVTNATLSSISIEPVSSSVANGVKVQYSASGVFSDGTSADITPFVTFISSNVNVATISFLQTVSGLASTHSAGSTNISAEYNSIISNIATLNVTVAIPTSLLISPASKTISKGEGFNYTAIASFSDNTSADVTTQTLFSSSTPSVLSVTASGEDAGVANALLVGTTNVTASYLALSSNTAAVTVTAATLQEIQLSPVETSVPNGVFVSYTAIAIFSDGTNANITSTVDFNSSDEDVATIESKTSNAGLVSTHTAGFTSIIASYKGLSSNSVSLNVTAATVMNLIVVPTTHSMPKGTSFEYRAFASYSDTSTLEVTDKATWTSADTSTVSIGAQTGLASAVKEGSTNISASFAGVISSNKATVNVTAATVVSVHIYPINKTLIKGTNHQYSVEAVYSDASVVDITGLTQIQTQDNNIAIFDENNLVYALNIGDVNISTTYEGISTSTNLSVVAASISSLVISPTDISIPLGTQGSFTAIANYDNNSSDDVTAECSWTSDDISIATIETTGINAGYAISRGVGTTLINATFDGLTTSTNITVSATTLQSIEILPANKTVANGIDTRYKATGVYLDNSRVDISKSVTWSSSNTSVAIIYADALGIVAESVAEGNTIITATLNSIVSNSAFLSVTSAVVTQVQVIPSNVSVPSGSEGTFRAIARFSDGSSNDVTTNSTWVSSVPNVVSIVPSSGFAQALSVGDSILTTTYEGVVSNGANTNVTAATLDDIILTPINSTVPNGVDVRFIATGVYSDGTTTDLSTLARFASSDTAVAIFNATGINAGLAETQSVGTTSITALYNGVTSSVPSTLSVTAATVTRVEITPATISVAKGTQGTLEARAYFSDGTNEVVTDQSSWTSSNPSVVSVVPDTGYLSAVGIGTSQIKALFRSVESTTSIVNVTNATLVSINLNPVMQRIANGIDVQYTATGIFSDGTNRNITRFVDYNSSDENIATIGSDGLVYTHNDGNVIFKASYNGIISNDANLTVTVATAISLTISPASKTLANGESFKYIATLHFSDNTSESVTKGIIFTSTNPSILSVVSTGTNAGSAQALSVGDANVSATYNNDFTSNTAQATVTNATLTEIQLSPPNTTISNGETQEYTAIGIFSDGTYQNITSAVDFNSSNESVAVIESFTQNAGLASSLTIGSTMITASYNGVISNNAILTVGSASITSIVVSPANKTIPKGTQYQYNAVAYYSDGSSAPITNQATWIAINTNVISVVAKSGLVTALNQGTTTLTANLLGVSSESVNVTVSSPTLVDVQITPNNKSYINGTTAKYKVTAIYSDYSAVDVTKQTQIQSLNPNIAIFDQNNLATMVGVGDAELTTTYNGLVSEREFLHVNAAILTSLDISPPNVSVPVGTQGRYTATAYYDNGSSEDVTEQTSWTSDNINIVNIVTSGTNAGYGDALSEGNTSINAAFGTKTTSTNIVVTSATLLSIEVTPVDTTVANGIEVDYLAIGVYSDTSRVDISLLAQWNTSNKAVATVFIDGSRVYASTSAEGNTNISASLDSINSNDALLTVTGIALQSIEILPGDITVPLGTTGNLTAEGYYSDGSHQDITSNVSWTSSNPTAVSITSNGGNAEALAIGHSFITAAYLEVTSTPSDITVTDKEFVRIQIDPGNESVADGINVRYTALGIFTDGTNTDVTSFVTFSSSNPSVALFSGSGSISNVAFTQNEGITSITATYDSLPSNIATLEVTQKTITRVAVEPFNVSVPTGTQGSFSATVYYSDFTSEIVTESSTWISSATDVVTVVSNGINAGDATAQELGEATVSATYKGVKSDPAQVSVTATTIVSIVLAPSVEIVPNGLSVQYIATGIYLDNSSKDITRFTTFSSSDTSVATIGSRGAISGKAITHAIGTTTITAEYNGVTSNIASLEVTAETIASIQIEPANIIVPNGTTGMYVATAYFTNGLSRDVTAEVIWTSAAPSTVTIQTAGTNPGYAEALSEGNTTISAEYLSMPSNVAQIQVTSSSLVSIQLTPNTTALPIGLTQQLTATGIYLDGSSIDLTPFAIYRSSDTSSATVSSSGLVTAHDGLSGWADINASYEGISSNKASIKVSASTPVELVITPPNAEVPIGTTGQFSAIAVYSDDTTRDVTGEVTWSSSNDVSVSIVTNNTIRGGFARALSVGSSDISAVLEEIPSNTAIVTVTAASLQRIDITPLEESISTGLKIQYTATGTFSDNTTSDLTAEVTWSTTNVTLATISQMGEATGVAVGTVTINASHALQDISSATINASATLHVTNAVLQSIQVTPADLVEPKGTSGQMNAMGYYSDGARDITNDVVWTTVDANIANIEQDGLLYLNNQGTTEVTATLSGTSDSVSVTVTDAVVIEIDIQPSNYTVPLGATKKYIAMGIYSDGTSSPIQQDVDWVSESISIASIDSLGLLTGISVGDTVIKATHNGITDTTPVSVSAATIMNIQITPANLVEPKGTSGNLIATATLSDNNTRDVTTEVTWVSDDTTKVFVHNTIDNAGYTELREVGTANVSATLGTISDTVVVTVTDATLVQIEITPISSIIALGLSVTYTAEGVYTDGTVTPINSDIVWRSSDTNVSTIDGNGFAQSLSTGSTSITATLDGLSDTSSLVVTAATVLSIEISPRNLVEPKGTSGQMTAMALYSDERLVDVTSQTTWTSSESGFVSIGSNTGVATLLEVGTSTITATFMGKTDTTTIEVTGAVLESIIIAPVDEQIARTLVVEYSATGVFSDGTQTPIDTSVSWSSSSTSVATIDLDGSATAILEGTTTITASQGTISDSTTLTVVALDVLRLEVSPQNQELVVNSTFAYTATAIFSNAPNYDATDIVNWSSSEESVAIIQNGEVLAIKAGTTIIKAFKNYLGVLYEATSTLTVVNGTLSEIIVSTTEPIIAINAQADFIATGIYDSGASVDITTQVVWATADSTIATVSNASPLQGKVSGHSAGTTDITATLGTINDAQPITVSVATIDSLSITPSSATIALGLSQAFEAYATMSDGSTQHITDSVIWSSSDDTVAQIEASGNAVSIAGGTTIITAVSTISPDKSDTATLNVIVPSVITLSISPTDPSIALGTTQQFVATLVVNGNENIVTALSTWSSSDEAIATINNDTTSVYIGLATSVNNGTTTINVEYYHEANGITYKATTSLGIADISNKPNYVRIQSVPTYQDPEVPLPVIQVNDTLQLYLIGVWVLSDTNTYTQDLTNEPQTSWKSNDKSVASISNNGIATGLEAGTSSIRGKYKNIEIVKDLTVE